MLPATSSNILTIIQPLSSLIITMASCSLTSLSGYASTLLPSASTTRCQNEPDLSHENGWDGISAILCNFCYLSNSYVLLSVMRFMRLWCVGLWHEIGADEVHIEYRLGAKVSTDGVFRCMKFIAKNQILVWSLWILSDRSSRSLTRHWTFLTISSMVKSLVPWGT